MHCRLTDQVPPRDPDLRDEIQWIDSGIVTNKRTEEESSRKLNPLSVKGARGP